MGQNLIDFKNFIQSEKFSQFTKGISTNITSHLGTYEKRVRAMVKDLDLKSRDARSKSREQLDRFASQLKTTRTQLEKRVVTLVNFEADRLNKGLNELVGYLKTLSKQEQSARNAKSRSAKKSTGKKKTSSAKKSGSKRKVSTASASSQATIN